MEVSLKAITSANGERKETQDKPIAKGKCGTVPIRVSVGTKKRMDALLRKANAKELGRRVKYEDVIAVALDKLGETEMAAIQDRALSNADRFEVEFRKRKESNRRLTKDEFIGQLLSENGNR